MSRLAWYWHRLRAMTPAEIALHGRKKWHQFTDARCRSDWRKWEIKAAGAFPLLPSPAKAPPVVREALQGDVEEILAGRWEAFGHLELRVDDPPRWHKDYLADRDLKTGESAFKLNHRELPRGADIKLIWELSRWHQLVRLAMAAYVWNDERAARKCLDWLEDWVKHNPPYRGWNWTSALEAGLRLIQFTWIDAFLATAFAAGTEATGRGDFQDVVNRQLASLRYAILPAHARYAWRHQSFGSSANNHLLGELAGLILAIVRWPALAHWAAPLEKLQRQWEGEVLAQFADDGGNKEQALHYHLFSWELCWQTQAALKRAGRRVSSIVEERLGAAAQFFWEVQVRREPWDYGDSDGGVVSPLFVRDETALLEWRDWLSRSVTGLGAGRAYWVGESPVAGPLLSRGQPIHARRTNDWWIYETSGIAICELSRWWLRWDLSPLGYLRTGAHGHLDALHLSLWFDGVALVIDPGTGSYFADPQLRSWLASWSAHNAPCPVGQDFPRRRGPFLWSAHHSPPRWESARDTKEGIFGLAGERQLGEGLVRRTVTRCADEDGWSVVDRFDAVDPASREFTVRWQFAPGAWVKVIDQRTFAVHRGDVSVTLTVAADWAEVHLVERESDRPATDPPLAGIVSPAFRKTEWAPYLRLSARPQRDRVGVFRTQFLAPPHS